MKSDSTPYKKFLTQNFNLSQENIRLKKQRKQAAYYLSIAKDILDTPPNQMPNEKER